MSKLSKHQIREDHIHDVLAEGFGNALYSLRDNWKLYAGIGTGALLVALGGVLLWNARSSKAEKASAILSKVQSAYNGQISPSGAISTPADEDNPTFPNEEARRKEVDKYVVEIQSKGAGTPARIGVLYAALEKANRGQTQEALKSLEPLTSDSDLAPLALKLRAKIYEGQSQWDKAEADWKAYAALKNPTVPEGEGLYLLGQYYERRQQVDKAVETYEKALTTLAKAPDESPLKTRIKAQVTSLKGTA